MNYDTRVVERWEKSRCEGHSTDSKAETLYISQTKKQSSAECRVKRYIIAARSRYKGKMIYDTQVVERWGKFRCEGHSTYSREGKFYINQAKNSSRRIQGDEIYYSRTSRLYKTRGV